MAAMTSFHAEKFYHLVNATHARRLLHAPAAEQRPA